MGPDGEHQDSKVKTGSVFPAFCHATFHHSLIRRAVMYPERGRIAQVCLDRDTLIRFKAM